MLVLVNITCFVACLKDPCADVFCSAKGECVNGTCLCESKYTGDGCENSFASYFAGNYKVFNNETDTILDTITFNIYNGRVDSIVISNYAGLNNNLRVLATVQNDSMINIFEQIAAFETEDSMEQQIMLVGKVLGKPTDTIYLSSTYTNNFGDFIYDKKLLKITN